MAAKTDRKDLPGVKIEDDFEMTQSTCQPIGIFVSWFWLFAVFAAAEGLDNEQAPAPSRRARGLSPGANLRSQRGLSRGHERVRARGATGAGGSTRYGSHSRAFWWISAWPIGRRDCSRAAGPGCRGSPSQGAGPGAAVVASTDLVDDAEEALRAAIEGAPDDANLLFALAQTLVNQGDRWRRPSRSSPVCVRIGRPIPV